MGYLLHHYLTESAGRRPDRSAVRFGEKEMTYAELEGISNRIAWVLYRHGVRKGDRVGLYTTKSAEALAGLYGILKAGGAYVPLDPFGPAKRAGFIANDCGLSVLIASAKRPMELRRLLAEKTPITLVLLVDGEPPPDAGEAVVWLGRTSLSGEPAVTAPPVEIINEDLAYILYTSGSTGSPKGVMLTHLNARTFVEWACETFAFESGDIFSNHAPWHFDLSVLDLFAAARCGAKVVPVSEPLAPFPAGVSDFIESEKITVWYSVPSALIQLLLRGGIDRHRFATLRSVLFAGEVFPVKYLRELMRRWPQARFHNLYGPTETNVCTWHTVPALEDGEEKPIPIGKACANTEVFVVDIEGKPVAPGEEGELWVRGATVMKGYWGDPKRTAGALVNDPVYPHLGGRVYRTGDLVAQQPDGTFRFLGRRDHQIKSRGFRIDLGEIEAALYSHPGVIEAAALPLPDEEVGNRIVGVIVSAGGEAPTVEQIREHCAGRLPRYMIPEAFRFLSSLPKTSTGKIDKQRLLSELKESRDRGAPRPTVRSN